jgi:hypothetical protein
MRSRLCFTDCSSRTDETRPRIKRSAALQRPVASSVTLPFEHTTMRVLTPRPRM